MNIIEERCADDVSELRKLAKNMGDHGVSLTANFLRGVADRYEILAGAYVRMTSRRASEADQS